MDCRGKKVAVIGLAVSNTPLIEYLAASGAEVTVFDRKEAASLSSYLNQLAGLNLQYHLGEDYLAHLTGFDLIFLTPGMRKDLPELQQAKAAGSVFSSEMEVFLKQAPGKVIAITGSSGKTTTTTLLGKMAAADSPETFVGGNIGRSLLRDLPRISSESRIILELSSFQLQMLKPTPDISVITNVTPNHLDMHASMQEYIDAKSNILRYQSSAGIAILNYDNEITRNLSGMVRGKLYYFSRQTILEEGAFVDGENLILKLNGKSELITPKAGLKLPGEHNVENVLTAALAARLSGISLSSITAVAQSFAGVEHRLELTRDWNGVTYYNDSISTTPDRAIAGLKAMTRPTVLIAGGYDKHLPFDRLAVEIVNRCKTLIVLGVTAPLIIEAVAKVNSSFPIIEVANLEAAVDQARKLSDPGDVVLLSPACASYDMFNNFQERGNLFKKLVNQLG